MAESGEYEFGLTVVRKHGEWKVVIDYLEEERAGVWAGDVDTALRMAVPYIATCCEPDPFTESRGLHEEGG